MNMTVLSRHILMMYKYTFMFSNIFSKRVGKQLLLLSGSIKTGIAFFRDEVYASQKDFPLRVNLFRREKTKRVDLLPLYLYPFTLV